MPKTTNFVRKKVLIEGQWISFIRNKRCICQKHYASLCHAFIIFIFYFFTFDQLKDSLYLSPLKMCSSVDAHACQILSCYLQCIFGLGNGSDYRTCKIGRKRPGWRHLKQIKKYHKFNNLYI